MHWTWHPTALSRKTTGHGMFSGTGFFTKEGKPAIIYHGEGSGRNWIAYALDDTLDTWSKPEAVVAKTADGKPANVRQWDPDCWLNGDTYYAISGGGNPSLAKSSDLKGDGVFTYRPGQNKGAGLRPPITFSAPLGRP